MEQWGLLYLRDRNGEKNLETRTAMNEAENYLHAR